MALLSVNGLKKSYVTRVLFEDISFEVEPGDHIGFIGVNGCGKSTLFAILEGRESYDEGMISIGRDTRLGSMEQTLDTRGVSLYTYVEGIFGELISIESELDSINERIQHEGATDALIERQSRLRERFEDEGGLTFRARTRSTLLGLGFTEEELSKDIALFSGGQRNKAQLARLLLSRANLLLLDEPTNHLDIKAIEWLEDFLSAYKGAFIVISHDRYFLDKVANRMIALVIYATVGRMVEQQRRWGQQHNFVTAFHKQKAADRIKETLVEPERDSASMHFKFTAKEGGGNDAVIIKGLAKSFGAKQVFANADMLVKRGEKVFILGDNGCGKTTLLNIIAGRLRPSAGSCMLGAHIEAAYYEQTMASLDPDKTVLNEVWDKYFNTISYKDIRNALGAFLFRGDEVEKKIGLLSGGEKARVQLLKLMLTRANLLLLDEPTNHLDIASREALENALDEYNGTMVIVTHDRYLVNRLADRIFLMTPSGLREFIGGYDDCLEAMKAGDETAAEEKKLSANAVEYRERKRRSPARKSAYRRPRRSSTGSTPGLPRPRTRPITSKRASFPKRRTRYGKT